VEAAGYSVQYLRVVAAAQMLEEAAGVLHLVKKEKMRLPEGHYLEQLVVLDQQV